MTRIMKVQLPQNYKQIAYLCKATAVADAKLKDDVHVTSQCRSQHGKINVCYNLNIYLKI